MKRILRYLPFTGLAALLILVGGCDLTSLNEDPNNPTEADPAKLFTNAQIDIADQYWQDYAGGFWVRYAQYWTTNQYTDADRYNYADSRPSSLNNLWEDYYLALNDLEEVKRLNQENPEAQAGFGPNENQIAMANIMQAWTLKIMTDMWGPIPVSEALQGREEENFTPAYDSQEQVYQTILDKLTTASNNLDTSTGALQGADLIYGGDPVKWKKFANSLKLRTAITLADVDPNTAETAINEALSAGVFESQEDSALLPFNTDPPYLNPFYENNVVSGRDDWAAPEGIVGLMNDTEDPRRPAYFTEEDGEFVGFPYGLEQDEAQSRFAQGNFSVPSDRVSATPDAPAIFMLYDEVLFIQAEAALHPDINPSEVTRPAQDLFEDALEASARYWGVSEQSTIDDWINNEVGAVDQDKLAKQKWLAQYLQGVPGWTTFRRYDFEDVFQIPTANPGQDQFNCDYAVRMVYPNDESTLNEENLQNAVSSLLGGDGASSDNQGVRLWWDTEAPYCN